MPAAPTKAWRQQAAEAVVRRALELQAQGRHLLLAGDSVAAGEVLAAPSADRLDGVTVCLLDVNEEVERVPSGARRPSSADARQRASASLTAGPSACGDVCPSARPDLTC